MRSRFFILLLCIAAGVMAGIGIMLPQLQRNSEARGESVSRYKHVVTTLFWVGEEADASNDFIANDRSYWDAQWEERAPKENPYYVALPYGEFTQEAGATVLKESAWRVPWFGKDEKPLLKNRWVEVVYEGRRCYGQWEDVGPSESDDFAYVFGDAAPKNTFGARAGLDVSPALFECLGLRDNAVTGWRFVDEEEVPEGPWKRVITTSPLDWSSR